MPSWIEQDDKDYTLIESYDVKHGKYTITIEQYESNITCTIYIKAVIKSKETTKLKVIGHVDAALLNRSCRFDFYNCCFQYSRSLARMSYDLFHPNGTLRSYKWTKISDTKRYKANMGGMLYFRKVFVDKKHRGHDLGFLACKHILRKASNKFSVSVIKPEYKNATHDYQRHLIRKLFSRLGYRPLDDGGNYPYQDFWFILAQDMKSGKKNSSCEWNLPVITKIDRCLQHILVCAQSYKDDSSIIKFIESYINQPDKDDSMETVLHHAAKQNMKRIVRCLLASQQVDINCEDEYGNTVLHICSLSMYKHLLKYPDIDIHVKNKAGKLPYDIAVEMFNVTRCHDYMQSRNPDFPAYEQFYFVLHELMPRDIYSSFMEGLLSPIMADTMQFSTGFCQATGMYDFIGMSGLTPCSKLRICDINEAFAELFPDCLRYRVVTLSFLIGVAELLKIMEKCFERDKLLPTKSRVMKLCNKSKHKNFCYSFFHQGGTFEDIIDIVINYAYADSFYHQKAKIDLIGAAEQKVWVCFKKVPYFDEDLQYIKAIMLNFLSRN